MLNLIENILFFNLNLFLTAFFFLVRIYFFIVNKAQFASIVKNVNDQFRVRLFWVKMISGNHFHPFPYVWLSRKISFSGKWLPVDQFFHLWPGNQLLPSFSLQMTSGKREREREEKAQIRERERRESDDRAGAIDDRRDRAARSSIYRRDRRSRGAIDEIARRDRQARSSDAHCSSALVGRAPLVGAIIDRRRDRWSGCISFAGFWFFCLIWCIFCKNLWMNQP